MSSTDHLQVLRKHVWQYHGGNKKVLGRLFALQEELAGKAGQLVMLVDHQRTSGSVDESPGSSIAGYITPDHVEEKVEADLTLAVLSDVDLCVGSTESTGLRTGKCVTGRPPRGNIAVQNGPLKLTEDQYWLLFGSSDGLDVIDDGCKQREHRIMVVAGNDGVLDWIRRSMSHIIPHHERHDWRDYIGYMVGALSPGMLSPSIQEMTEQSRENYLRHLRYLDTTLQKLGDDGGELAACNRIKLLQLLGLAEANGMAQHELVLHLGQRYPELT